MIDVDTSQVDALARDLGRAGAKAKVGATKAVKTVGSAVRRDAEANAPVDTGELRDNVVEESDGDSVRVGTYKKQGFFQEFGTSVMAPQPWLFPALDKNANSLAEAIEVVAARVIV